jgi:anti-sigma B factor antagonist
VEKLKVDIQDGGDLVIVAVEGRLDATNAAAFDEAVKSLATLSPPRKIIMDLKDLEFVSSAGLRSFLTLGKACRVSGAQLGFCSLRSLVADVFKISGFVTIFSLFADRQEALNTWGTET